ncbi:MAG: AAA family ATPase [Dehalococcoidia bacterium]|nr:AAA family ATPase [Dehalococcoidia bacterium]
MIDVAGIEKKLRTRYGNIERVGDGVVRAVDKYAGREYAIRYFDLTDDLFSRADELRKYQEKILSHTYYSGNASKDLRWNHYLYFVTSTAVSKNQVFARTKAKVEADREYARKMVILEDKVDSLLAESLPAYQAVSQAMPSDLATMWQGRLDEKGLAYVLDEDVSVPEAARSIAAGQVKKAERITAPLALTKSEKAAAGYFLRELRITGFRSYPREKIHRFGKVNLIVGSNGTGKTSLLEAIEFLFCGQTRRPGNLPPNTSISADFVDSREKLVTSMETLPRQLRARHSHWYAKTELKTLTLAESFGKFNFLDTDAAVRLTVEDSEERIGPEVMRLLLGSGAERLQDRLRRVRDKLEHFAEDRERNLSTDKQLLLDSLQRLDVARRAPRMTDTLFADLCTALKRLDWRVMPATKQEAAMISESLQVALTATQILVRSGIDVLTINEGALLDRHKAIMEAIQSATKVNNQWKDASLSLAQTTRDQASLHSQLLALDALLPYAKADYWKNAVEMRELRQRVDALSARMSIFGDDDIGLELSDGLGLPIGTELATADTLLADQNKRLADARFALKAMENTHATVTVLHQRLVKAAQELLSIVPNPDLCPICHTEFESGQLQNRMLSGVIEDSESRLAELQSEVLSAEQELARRQKRSTALGRLVAFIRNEHEMSVSEAMEAVIQAQRILTLERTRLAEMERHLQRLAASGLREEDLPIHLTIVGLDHLVEESELLRRKAIVTDQLRRVLEAEELAKNTLQSANEFCEHLATSFAVDIDVTPEELAKQLRMQASDLDGIIKAKGDLTALLDLKDKTLEALTVQLEHAQSHLQNLTTALAKETAEVGAAAIEEKKIEMLGDQIKKTGEERERLHEAIRLLDELIGQSTSGGLVSTILSENASAISQIFDAIHAPNEFEVKTEQGKLVIRRRETEKDVILTGMSSGQRAAYALSLFLSMNVRLVSGPRVLLFDDPIAHVDDMNVLSVLDHLRDIAIQGSRQIFFATADTKLAGLFRQKFRFLGEADFCEISLNRE